MNNPTVLKPIGRITSVDMLRGIAALMVCIFHFTNGNKNYLASGHWFRNFGSYGWAGVEIFFIISGFIIPYSLNQSKYTYQNWKDFLIKRISRIEPPYFITILLILALNYVSTLSPYFKGKDLPIDYFNLALHIGYLNSFFDHPWLNPVFWTLAIEFQFYLLMALIFPLLIHSSTYVRATIVFAYLLSMFFFSSKFIFYYSAYFSIGILIFYGTIYTSKWKLIYQTCSGLILGVVYYKFGATPFFASLFAWIILIFFKKIKYNWILFLGTISYSLYLIHVPLGGRMINLSMNFFKTDIQRTLFIIFTLVLIVFASYVFYLLVELPAIRLSQKVYNNLKKHSKKF